MPAASDTAPDLPGCESFRMTAREVGRSEERLEFWDARTETAWKVRDVYIHSLSARSCCAEATSSAIADNTYKTSATR